MITLMLPILTVAFALSSHPSPPNTPGIIAYLASWNIGKPGPRILDLPGDKLTHINYAFALISPDGKITLGDPCSDAGDCDNKLHAGSTPGGNFRQLQLLKNRYPHLKLIISVGGWTGSGKFSDVALTPESRATFVRSGLDLFIRRWTGLFDGIDIDWEFPVAGGLPQNSARPEDKQNFTLLLAEFRRQLDAQAKLDHRPYSLSIASSARPEEIANLELDRITPLLDWFDVMTYDYHSGSQITGFNAPLYAPAGDPTPLLNIDATLRIYEEGGVPPEKFVLGVPFYGRAYGGVAATNNGLFQPSTAPPPKAWSGEDLDYRVLVQKRPLANGFRRFWDAKALVPSLYNPALRTWITYDDPHSIAAKTDYARSHHLGGIMAWELAADDGTLLSTIYHHLHPRP